METHEPGAESVRVVRGIGWDNADGRVGQMLNESSYSKRRGFLTEARESGKLKDKIGVTKKECKMLREEFKVGGFLAQKRFVEHRQKRVFWKTEERCFDNRKSESEKTQGNA